jgi:hypothetical protein
MTTTPDKEYERVMEMIGTRWESMRGRVSEILFENVNVMVSPAYIAEKIGTTPTLGDRGGEPATSSHVIKAAEYVQRRLVEKGTGYKIINSNGWGDLKLIKN